MLDINFIIYKINTNIDYINTKINNIFVMCGNMFTEKKDEGYTIISKNNIKYLSHEELWDDFE